VKTYACPTCKQVAVRDGNKLFPFCSERCHLVDLGRWLGEEYRVPGEPDLAALEAASEELAKKS
jgi:endogenous inhibitor of DNA gyrase (YacG/DUF329 family)